MENGHKDWFSLAIFIARSTFCDFLFYLFIFFIFSFLLFHENWTKSVLVHIPRWDKRNISIAKSRSRDKNSKWKNRVKGFGIRVLDPADFLDLLQVSLVGFMKRKKWIVFWIPSFVQFLISLQRWHTVCKIIYIHTFLHHKID